MFNIEQWDSIIFDTTKAKGTNPHIEYLINLVLCTK